MLVVNLVFMHGSRNRRAISQLQEMPIWPSAARNQAAGIGHRSLAQWGVAAILTRGSYPFSFQRPAGANSRLDKT